MVEYISTQFFGAAQIHYGAAAPDSGSLFSYLGNKTVEIPVARVVVRVRHKAVLCCGLHMIYIDRSHTHRHSLAAQRSESGR